MKKSILCFIAALVLSVPAYAAEEKIAVTTKQGNIYLWKTMYEKNDSVCTQKSYGEMCIPKSEIKEIAKGDKDAGDKIVEEKRTDVGRVEIQSTSFSDTATATSQTEETNALSVIPTPKCFSSTCGKWDWVKDNSAKEKLMRERQQIIKDSETSTEKLNREAQSRGLGTVKMIK